VPQLDLVEDLDETVAVVDPTSSRVEEELPHLRCVTMPNRPLQ
jgi:hypothetical protein